MFRRSGHRFADKNMRHSRTPGRSWRSPASKRIGRGFAETRRIGLRKTAEMGEAELELDVRHLLESVERQSLAGQVETQVAGDLAWGLAAKPLEPVLQRSLADAGDVRQRGHG